MISGKAWFCANTSVGLFTFGCSSCACTRHDWVNQICRVRSCFIWFQKQLLNMKGKAKNPTIAVWLYITKNIKCRLSSSTLFREILWDWFIPKAKDLICVGMQLEATGLQLSWTINKFLLPVFLVTYPRNHCLDQYQGSFSLCFLLGILCFQILGLNLGSIFVSGIRYKLSFILLTHLFFWCIYI